MPGRRRAAVRPYKPSGAWGGVIIGVVAIPAASKVLLTTFVNDTDFQATVRRTRISALYSSDQTAAGESTAGALGCAVLENTAITVGIGSLPDPVTDVDEDIWFVFQGLHSRFATTGAGIAETAGSLYEIDSKAMRKVPQGKSVALIVANQSAVAGALIQLTVRIYSTMTRA